MKNTLLALLVFTCSAVFAQQNDLNMPEESPAAAVSQTIGVSTVSVSYHSPKVNGRKVWGGLVPYNELWRAGANENTTVQFSTEVSINGKKLSAGIYGLHMIPTEKEWTIIFSKNYYSWGSYFYKQSDDALRVTATPQMLNSSQDWLSFTFENLKNSSADLCLNWEKVKLPITISVDLNQTVTESFHQQLNGLPGFFPDAYYQAAQWSIGHKVNEAEAKKWLDHSIQLQPGFENQFLKAEMLQKEGKEAEAAEMMKKAMAMADENGMNRYGYNLAAQGKNAEALAVFKDVVKKYPTSWNAYDSLGEAYEKVGNKKEALANFKIARQKAPQNQYARIDAIISRIEKM